MPSSQFGPLLVFVGVLLVLADLLMWMGALDWFGRLPGDIRIERGQTRIYIPLVSMLLISVVLSLLVHLFRRLVRGF